MDVKKFQSKSFRFEIFCQARREEVQSQEFLCGTIPKDIPQTPSLTLILQSLFSSSTIRRFPEPFSIFGTETYFLFFQQAFPVTEKKFKSREKVSKNFPFSCRGELYSKVNICCHKWNRRKINLWSTIRFS